MALEELSLSSGGRPISVDGTPNKAPRLPRWTRQEILVLIQGKRVAENRVRRGRTAALACSSAQPEPKWASVSSYCRRHGVNRGPVQCRKRWSNLAGDFKKIKEWESQIKDDSQSFWAMRNDLRRERKLPGFFDKEVYDILDGSAPITVTAAAASASASASGLALALAAPADDKEGGDDHELEAEAVFDSGRSAAAEDSLFSDCEESGQEELGKVTPEKELPTPMPISEMNEKETGLNHEIGSSSHQGKKRKRLVPEVDGETASQPERDPLIDVLERNGRILSSHLEAQNSNLNLDREERKDHANNLVAVLNKLADALGRIADKL